LLYKENGFHASICPPACLVCALNFSRHRARACKASWRRTPVCTGSGALIKRTRRTSPSAPAVSVRATHRAKQSKKLAHAAVQSGSRCVHRRVFSGKVASASLKALGAEALDLVEGLLLGLADAIAEAIVRPIEDCTLGKVRSISRRLDRFVAQASDPRGLLLHLPRHAAPGIKGGRQALLSWLAVLVVDAPPPEKLLTPGIARAVPVPRSPR